MPSPDCERLSRASACANMSNTRDSASAGYADAGIADRDDRRLARRDAAAIEMRPPGSVYLAALLSRFENTCARRTASPSRSNSSVGSETVEPMIRRIDQRPAGFDRVGDDGRQIHGAFCSSILPRVMRETSIRSSISRTM